MRPVSSRSRPMGRDHQTTGSGVHDHHQRRLRHDHQQLHEAAFRERMQELEPEARPPNSPSIRLLLRLRQSLDHRFTRIPRETSRERLGPADELRLLPSTRRGDARGFGRRAKHMIQRTCWHHSDEGVAVCV